MGREAGDSGERERGTDVGPDILAQAGGIPHPALPQREGERYGISVEIENKWREDRSARRSRAGAHRKNQGAEEGP